MEYVILIVFLFLTFFFGFQYFLILKSKRIIGKNILFEKLRPDLREKLENKRTLIYFYSQNCSACKAQAPVIEKLKKEDFNIVSIDVSRDLETARVFGIMGTPSIAILENNFVQEFLVGYQDEEKLKKLFLANTVQ